MTEIPKKPYNLETRTLEFAKAVIRLCKRLPKTAVNLELIKQLIKAGTSVGANYREANEALSSKDFLHRMRITRKETKESTYWLEVVCEANPEFTEEIRSLLEETKELRSIFTAIINKSK